jgi:hypothetical protein
MDETIEYKKRVLDYYKIHVQLELQTTKILLCYYYLTIL